MKTILKVGLTGNIGSGKSYVADIFNMKYDIPIYNSDKRAKYLMVNELKSKIIKTFGEDSYIDGQINKVKFNKLLFNDKSSLLLMDSIVIPAMEKDFDNYCSKLESVYVIMESAIIFETNTQSSVDKIICVVADIDIRKKRVTERDKISEDLFLKKVNNQYIDEKKINLSDYVIYNNSDSNVEEQIEKIHKSLINFFIKIN
jgi:dephospho-CoA kinase